MWLDARYAMHARHADRRPVLVVEDSDDDFDSVVDAAARAKVRNRLVRAATADSARDLLAQQPAGSFAFMLLDYNLPGTDGLVLLGHIRRDPLLAQLPAVVYTTSVNPHDRDAFYRAGANSVHVKDVQYSDCLRTLESIFKQWLNRGAVPDAAASLSPGWHSA